MRIPAHIKDQIYQATNIVEVVSDYVQLKKKGTNWWGLSPFKTERTPSFSVHEAKGIYKDFSSGKGGTAVGFLMELEGYTYSEALLHLARKYNIEVAELEPEDAAHEDARASMFALNNHAAAWFHQQLQETDEGKQYARSYFKERGFSDALIQQWQLGYSPSGWDVFSTHAVKQQFQEKYLLDTGLSIRSEKSGNLIDRFHGRVMFPILDVTGKVAGFGARILGNDAKQAKYLNSPDSPVYNKSQVLFGLYFARQEIRNQGVAYIVEGYTDVLALHQAGIQTAVASCGTSLVDDQIRILSRYAKTLVLLYDGDTAGIQATQRALPLILAQGLTPKILQLPDNHDPDSYLKAFGPAAFEAFAADNTQSFLPYLLAQLVPPNADAAAKAQAADRLAQVIAFIPDAISRELHLQESANLLGLDVNLLRNVAHTTAKKAAAREHRAQIATHKPAEDAAQATHQQPVETQEYELLRLLLNYPEQLVDYDGHTLTLFEVVAEHVSEITFKNTVFNEIKDFFFVYYPQRQEATVKLMQDEMPQSVAYVVTQLLAERYTLSDRWMQIDRNTPAYDANLSYVLEQALLYYKRAHFLLLKDELLKKVKLCQEQQAQKEDADTTELDDEMIQILVKSQKLDVLLNEISTKLKNVVY